VAPTDAFAMAGLAVVALAQDDLPAAEQAARQAADADKKLWFAQYALGRVLLKKADVDGAYKCFDKGKGTKNREDGRDLFESAMGLVGVAEKDPNGAETSFVRARGLAPNTLVHVLNLADLYESTNSWGQAANVLEEVARKTEPTPELTFRLGRAYENLKRWQDAVRQYQVSLHADSTYVPSLAALGHLYLLDTSKTPAAVNLLQRAVDLRPTPAARLDLGIALVRANRAAEAVPILEAVVAEAPDPQAKVALARAYLKSDKPQKGLDLIADPDVRAEATASDLTLVAGALIQAKDFAKAKTFLDAAEEKDPELSDIAYRRGMILLYEKDYDGAIARFQEKIQKDQAKKEPESAATWLNLGTAYIGKGDNQNAVAAFRKVTELAPNSAQAWAQYGSVLGATGASAPAKAAYEKALSIDANMAAALRGRGYLLLVEKQYPQAIADLRRAADLDPKNADGWAWLGQAYHNSGSVADARACYEKAIAIDPNNAAAQEGLALIAGKSK
jgi:tetratricopeptide (TPR) repeat protein